MSENRQRLSPAPAPVPAPVRETSLPVVTRGRSPVGVATALAGPPPLARPAALQLQKTIGNQAVQRLVQRHSGERAAPSPADMHAAAAQGIRTPAASYPHRRRIEAALGEGSLAGVTAHIGSEATANAGSIDAAAYAFGDHVVFAGQPSLRTAAHEAAHVLQQRAGIHLAGGVGRVGDVYERQADAVADRVASGGAVAPPDTAGAVTHSSPVVQRRVVNKRPDPSPASEDRKEIDTFYTEVNNKVTQAREFVIGCPRLGAFSNLDGHTWHWVRMFNAFLHDPPRNMGLLPAAFGYAVESLVSNQGGNYYIEAPAGYAVVPQVTHGGTRPDLVLKKLSTISGQAPTEIAWADITASNSTGHIFFKACWGSVIREYAEITYESLKDIDYTFMISNQNADGGAVPTDVTARLAKHRMIQDKLDNTIPELRHSILTSINEQVNIGFFKAESTWKLASKEIMDEEAALVSMAKDSKPIVKKLSKKNDDYDILRGRASYKATAELDKDLPMKIVAGVIRGLGLEVPESAIPSILVALGINPKTYHFSGVASEGAGRILLVDILKIEG